MILEIHLPLRNPTEVLDRTVDSLSEQTDRNFAVVISDNHSTEGSDRIASAVNRLKTAGISCRKVMPPTELERVEHWNWMHSEAQARWIKPLFAGDWLESSCVARFNETISRSPEVRFVHAGYQLHPGDEPPVSNLSHCFDQFRSPEEMSDLVLRVGHQFGPPSTFAFEHSAFLAIGGYRPTLPICADNLLCCTLAARFGVVGIPELLCHFRIHNARFSHALKGRQKAILRETITYHFLLVYHAWADARPIPWVGVARMVARQMRNYLASK